MLRDLNENAASASHSRLVSIGITTSPQCDRPFRGTQVPAEKCWITLKAQSATFHAMCLGKTYQKVKSRLLLASASRKPAGGRLATPRPSSARLVLSSTTSANIEKLCIQHIDHVAGLRAPHCQDASLSHERALPHLQRYQTADNPASQRFRQAQNFDPHTREAPLLWLLGPDIRQRGRMLAFQASPADVSLQHRDWSVRPLRPINACLQQ